MVMVLNNINEKTVYILKCSHNLWNLKFLLSYRKTNFNIIVPSSKTYIKPIARSIILPILNQLQINVQTVTEPNFRGGGARHFLRVANAPPPKIFQTSVFLCLYVSLLINLVILCTIST